MSNHSFNNQHVDNHMLVVHLKGDYMMEASIKAAPFCKKWFKKNSKNVAAPKTENSCFALEM